MVKPHYVELSNQLKENATFFDADLEQLHSVAEQLGIRTTPTLLAFRDGEEVDRRHGALMHAQLEKWMTGHLDAHITHTGSP